MHFVILSLMGLSSCPRDGSCYEVHGYHSQFITRTGKCTKYPYWLVHWFRSVTAISLIGSDFSYELTAKCCLVVHVIMKCQDMIIRSLVFLVEMFSVDIGLCFHETKLLSLVPVWAQVFTCLFLVYYWSYDYWETRQAYVWNFHVDYA